MNSMTGFGKGEIQEAKFLLSIEIKSVNHRFKDIRLKFPGIFSSLEIPMRKTIEQSFVRGSFEVFLSYKKITSEALFDEIDPKKVKQFNKLIQEITGESHLDIRPCDYLRSEFYVDQSTEVNETLKNAALSALDLAIKQLQSARHAEGANLKKILEGHLSEFESALAKIIQEEPKVAVALKEKFEKKVSDYLKDHTLDQQRLEQELIYYLEKLDISEEIDRIKSHLKSFKEIINSNGEIGRKLDFLLQELNRETNTIGSKTDRQVISEHIVKMKVSLEKLREQALNIE